VIEWQVHNPKVLGLRPTGAHFEKQNSPEISGDCEVARCCAGKNHALIAETFSGRGTLSSGVTRCMYRNFTFRLVTV